MKLKLRAAHETAFTLFDTLVVVAIVVVVAALLVAVLTHSNDGRKVARINCVNNLKQIGLAYRIWEGDNNDKNPMGVCVTNGGSMERAETGDVVLTFQVMSNELSTTKILCCPNDSRRRGAASFSALSPANISYLVGLDATNQADLTRILSGDSNFEIRGKAVRTGLVSVGTNDPIAWQSDRHRNSGNLGLGDGSVQSPTSAGLRAYLAGTGLATNRWAIP